MAGFQFGYLNTRYTERFGEEYVVAERETYWNTMLDYFIYLCDYEDRWIIAAAGVYEDVRKSVCSYTAKGPQGTDILSVQEPAQHWWEWNPAAGVLQDRPMATVAHLSTKEWLEGGGFAAAEFDSLDMFPQCKRPPYQPIDYVSSYENKLSFRAEMTSNTQLNQGSCNNCWAVTIAELVERLLCIGSQGQWQGPRAFLSAAYITACASSAFVLPGDGCQGGRALDALWWIGEHGVPTGGPFGTDETCVPLFGADQVKAPACPTQCTRSTYPRTLQEDLFAPKGLIYSYQTDAVETAKQAMQFGPIIIRIPLYEDFFNYTGGLYEHTWGEQTPMKYHFLVAHGFSGAFIRGFNTWGDSWGFHGSFMVKWDLPDLFIIPGRITGTGPGYAFPLPRGVQSVEMRGFSQNSLNGRYEVWFHELGIINGHPSFWCEPRHVLYWCAASSFWAVEELSEYGSIGQGNSSKLGLQAYGALKRAKEALEASCGWVAHGPPLPQYTEMAMLPELFKRGWSERSQGGGVAVLAAAGVDSLSI